MRVAFKPQVRRPREAKLIQSRRQDLTIQHADGWIENLGEVEVTVWADSAGARRVQWRAADGRAAAAAIVHMDDLRRPLEVRMREGGKQLWFLGEQATARNAARRYYDRQPAVLAA